MSAIDPEKQAIVQELVTRRSSLDPEKQAIVDELSSRLGVNNPMASISPGELAARQAQSKATADAIQPESYLSRLKAGLGEFAKTAMNINQGGEGPQLATGQESTGNTYLDIAKDIAGSASPAAASLGRLPISKTAAANAFQEIMSAAKDVTVDTSKVAPIVQNIQTLAAHGAESPGVALANKLDTALQKGPLTYQDVSEFATSAGKKLSKLQKLFTPSDQRVEAEVGKLYGALQSAKQEGAQFMGMGDMMQAATDEYRRAMKLRQLGKLGLVGGAGALGIGKTLGFVNTIRDITGY